MAYGGPVEFDEVRGRRARRISEYARGEVTEEDRHDEMIDWFVERGELMRKALEAVSLPQDLFER